MIQDKQLLDDFHSLPPDKQAEVIDFVEHLKKKEQHSSDEEAKKLALAEALLFGKSEDMAEKEIALWDAVVESLGEPVRFNEPDLSSYDS